MICVFTDRCLFPLGTQWKKMLFGARMSQIVASVIFFSPISLLCCWITSEAGANAAPSIVNYMVQNVLDLSIV